MTDIQKTIADTVFATTATTAKDQAIFDTVAPFHKACRDAYEGGLQRLVLEQMVRSSILAVYGCSWITELERQVCAATVTAILDAYDRDKQKAWHQIQHENHIADGKRVDNNCEVCIEAES